MSKYAMFLNSNQSGYYNTPDFVGFAPTLEEAEKTLENLLNDNCQCEPEPCECDEDDECLCSDEIDCNCWFKTEEVADDVSIYYENKFYTEIGFLEKQLVDKIQSIQYLERRMNEYKDKKEIIEIEIEKLDNNIAKSLNQAKEIQAEIERKRAGLELVEVSYQITVDKKMFIEMPIEKMKMVDDPRLDVFFEIERKVQEAEPNYVPESFSFNGIGY